METFTTIKTTLNNGVIHQSDDMIKFDGCSDLNLNINKTDDATIGRHVYFYMYLKDVILNNQEMKVNKDLTNHIKKLFKESKHDPDALYGFKHDGIEFVVNIKDSLVHLKRGNTNLVYFINDALAAFQIYDIDLIYLKLKDFPTHTLTINPINKKFRSAGYQLNEKLKLKKYIL